MSAPAKSTAARVALFLAAIVGVSAFAYSRMRPKALPDQVTYGNGRIEADEIRVGVEVAGRLLEMNAVEGAAIQEGGLVARVDDTDYELQRVRAAAEQRAATEMTAQLTAQVELADHHAETARTDLQRYESLGRDGVASGQRLDLARNAYREAADQASVLRARKSQAEAQAEAADAMVALAASQIAKTRVVAPRPGVVLERLSEPGEIVAPGQPVAIIADLSTVRLRIFITERDLGKVRLDAPARIRADSFPEREFEARVSQVDAQAQFTPRDVHMQDERSRTVYGVMLEASNADGVLKPGMPADAWILRDANAEWPTLLFVPD